MAPKGLPISPHTTASTMHRPYSMCMEKTILAVEKRVKIRCCAQQTLGGLG
jgi:hypothetical protein